MRRVIPRDMKVKGAGTAKQRLIRGRERAAAIDPTEMWPLKPNPAIKTRRAKLVGSGIMAAKTPAEVATPLPPRKPKNKVQSWPIIAKAPQRIMGK